MDSLWPVTGFEHQIQVFNILELVPVHKEANVPLCYKSEELVARMEVLYFLMHPLQVVAQPDQMAL